jgi:hypothetical protein
MRSTLLAVKAMGLAVGLLRWVRAAPRVAGLLLVRPLVLRLDVGLLVVVALAVVALRVLTPAVAVGVLAASVVLAHAQLQPSTSLRPFQETPRS